MIGSAITQISPALPPALSGVGDYVATLTGMLGRGGAKLHLLSMSASARMEGASVGTLVPEADALLAALQPTGTNLTILHFSGYGYARWGLCWWLVEGLERWKRASPGRRLVTVFHEVYASGPIWRTSFWTSPPQRRIARRIAALSDASVATSEAGAEQLRSLRPDLSAAVLPVFSNVRELDAPPALSERAPVAVAFGQRERRRALYAALAAMPEAIAGLRRLGIERIHDIGPPAGVADSLAGLPVQHLGPLAPRETSAHLGGARIGLLDYPHHVITKSSIFAAYLAHGVLAVNTSSIGTLPADLREGRHFLHPRRLGDPGVDPQAVADAGFAWYQPHNVRATSSIIAGLIA
jgi:hypothetical protein